MQKPKKPNIFFILFSFLLVWWVVSSFASLSTSTYNSTYEPISEILTEIKNGNVNKVEVKGDLVKAFLKDDKTLEARKETNTSFDEVLKNANIDTSKIPNGLFIYEQIPWGDVLLNFLPILITAGLFFFFFRQARGAAGDVFSFGKSRAKMFFKNPKEGSKITFKDVAGAKETKQELTEVVDFLKNPDKYRKLGARIPRGVLLIGPSGVGKTLLARAISGEAGVPFFNAAGSEFMEMLVGVGASRVRDLFATAKASQPSVIFIDEIDAIGRQRGYGLAGGHDEREQTLNQILVEMDGFDQRTNVLVLAATNRPDLLDPALVRPGRFDRRVTLELPDINEREEVFTIHMKGKPFSENVSIRKLAEQTVGFSGADIENMINEAAILAARMEKKEIEMKDLANAATKVKLGPERKRLQTEEEKKITAYHEAGHTLVALKTPDTDPVQRVSIISRSLALGFTDFSPSRDRYNETKKRLLSFITIALGGRVAEKLVFDEETVGAANDIERATKLAKRMVCEFGMSALGPIQYANGEDKAWLAMQLGENISYSQAMAEKIDEEIKKIINSCYKNAETLLTKERKLLDKLSEELVKKETLEKEDLEKILLK